MKGTIDKIVEEIQAWESVAHDATAVASPQDLHGTPVPGTVGTISAETAAWDPWRRAMQSATQGAVGHVPAPSVASLPGV